MKRSRFIAEQSETHVRTRGRKLRLKKIVADLVLDDALLRDVAGRKLTAEQRRRVVAHS